MHDVTEDVQIQNTRNPESKWNPESGIQNPESGIQNQSARQLRWNNYNVESLVNLVCPVTPVFRQCEGIHYQWVFIVFHCETNSNTVPKSLLVQSLMVEQ